MATNPCDARILHVSSETGIDAEDRGCAADQPLKSIGAAIARAKLQSLTGFEIHVCAGRYVERRLVLDHPISLRGGYSCNGFARARAFEFPTLEGIDSTRIENGDYSGQTSTLLVRGGAVGAAVVIDGLTIVAPTAGDRGGVALAVTDAASPKITDNDILDGATTADNAVGSIGISIVRASPEITRTRISAGRGASSWVWQSYGIQAEGAEAKPTVHDNLIKLAGGRSVGIEAMGVEFPGDRPLAGNRIECGAINGRVVGIHVGSKTSVVLTNNYVRGGVVECSALPCTSTGILVDDATDVKIERNRIFAGDVAMGSTARVVPIGVSLNTEKATIHDSLILGGNEQQGGPGDPFTIAVEIAKTTIAELSQNTVVIPGNNRSGIGVEVVPSTNVIPGAREVTLLNNLFVDPNRIASAIAMSTCITFPSLVSLRGNAFANTKNVLEAKAGPCAVPATAYPNLSDAEVRMAQLGVASILQNLRLTNSCEGEQTRNGSECKLTEGCAPDRCAPLLMAGWTLPALDEGKWQLVPGGPCRLLQGAFAIEKPVATTDFAGAPRTEPRSIGAYESDDRCSN